MKDELLDRLHRCYAAIDAAVEGDLSKFPPKIIAGEKQFGLYQDFLDGLTEPQISNLAHTLIHNIANLRDHLRRWAGKNGLDQKDIERTIAGCAALQMIIDLSNNDKHGYPSRDGGHSKRSPKLLDVKRVLRMSAGPVAGLGIAIVFMPTGPKQIASGGGFSQVLVTGSVVDGSGAPLGDLYELGIEALKAWERQFAAFGIGSGQYNSRLKRSAKQLRCRVPVALRAPALA
ncbi:MAG: hypothetical protein GDA68_19900 [Nitrospira sp. CR2.1]|nr:hypothetical protein [Nitrospira sp. CR2.1]MBA5874788.1 hypothetical protein [Nitrospira sp. CR1.2]